MQYYFSGSDGAGEARGCLSDAWNDIRASAPFSGARDRILKNLQFVLQMPDSAYKRNRDDETGSGACDRSFDIEQRFGRPFETNEWGTVSASVRFSWSKMYDEHLEIRFRYVQYVNGARRSTVESGYNTIVFFRRKVKRFSTQGYDQVTLFEN